MNTEHKEDYHQVHFNHEIYSYAITHEGVMIKTPDGSVNSYSKKQVKGESLPVLFKKLFNRGRRNIKLTHVDIVKFVKRHYR